MIGFLVLDKPLGISSAAAVARVKRTLAPARCRVGHVGTLDPLASGVLPLALGAATRASAFVQEGEKEYRFMVRWGIATASDDAEGEVVERSAVRPQEDAIRAALAGFVGEQDQTPPAFSAVHVNGKRAYQLARDGKPPVLAARRVRIMDLRLLACADGDHAEFTMRCGKGVYVRSLARDLARALGTCGHVSALRRLRVGPFALGDAVGLAALEAREPAAPLPLRPLKEVLAHLPQHEIGAEAAARVRHGGRVRLFQRTSNTAPAAGREPAVKSAADTAPALALAKGEIVALGRVQNGEFQPTRLLCF